MKTYWGLPPTCWFASIIAPIGLANFINRQYAQWLLYSTCLYGLSLGPPSRAAWNQTYTWNDRLNINYASNTVWHTRKQKLAFSSSFNVAFHFHWGARLHMLFLLIYGDWRNYKSNWIRKFFLHIEDKDLAMLNLFKITFFKINRYANQAQI